MLQPRTDRTESRHARHASPVLAPQAESGAAIQLRGLSHSQGMAALSPCLRQGHDIQRRALSPIQCKGGSATVHSAAQRGTRGAGSQLPYLAQIQGGFGRHDVSGIKAHTGSEASAACDQMGAQAYASGSDVAFKGAADLHTAAHEAAHVVQQRAGAVSLSGGVGQVGDVYERHADSVADAVVQGKSAEGLLDQMAGGGSTDASVQQKGTPSAPVVQRAPGTETSDQVAAAMNTSECEATADVSGDYAAFDNALGQAEIHADTYLQSASNQVQNMMVSYTTAVNRFQTQLNAKSSESGEASLGAELLLSALSIALPGVVPISAALLRVASKDFYAEAIGFAIDAVKEVLKTGIEYTGPVSPQVGDVSSTQGLIQSAISVNEQENLIRKELFTTLRQSFDANKQSDTPEPMTLDIKCIAKTAFAPIGEVVTDAWTKTMEEMLWRDYIAKSVEWTFNYPLLSPSDIGFNGLSDVNICYLLDRFGWQTHEIAHMATKITQSWVRDKGETRIPRTNDDYYVPADVEYCEENHPQN